MARSKTKGKARCYIEIDGENVLQCEINLDTGEVKWYLPQEEVESQQKDMMENTGENMSRYIENHLESALWKKT